MKFDVKKIAEKFIYDPNSVKKNYDGKTDIYLAKVSYRYAYFRRIARALIMLVLTLFLLSGSLSYDKIYYLTKEIKLANDYVNSVHDTISYNVGNSQSFAKYREGLAVASRDRLSIFSAGGRELFSSNHDYTNPKLAASEKSILLYNFGGNQFSLYNSFSKRHEDKLSYSIYGADIASDGTFALITKSDDFDSAICLYKNDGTKYEYKFVSGFVTLMSLSDDGSKMAVAITSANGSEIKTELRLYKVGSKEYKSAVLDFSDICFDMKILDTGDLAIVNSHSVSIFNSNLNLIGEYSSKSEIYLCAFGDDNIVLSSVSDKTGMTEITLVNRRGRIDKKFEVEYGVIDIGISNNNIFLQYLNGFEKINIFFGTSSKVNIVANDYKMLVYGRDTILICKSSFAKFINFKQ